MDAYEKLIRDPGGEISSGTDMFRTFGYTDMRNPIYGFDLMNDSNFRYLKEMIDNKIHPSEIPEKYNANIIRLRDYRLGDMLNAFKDWCDSTLVPYEDSWEEYRDEHNPTMPESFYDFWMLYDNVTFGKILPYFINLIDPISMQWIDPEYPKITTKDGYYQYRIDKPILTSNPSFLFPDTKMDYISHKPNDPAPYIYEEINEMIDEYIPRSIHMLACIHNELEYGEEKPDETEKEFIARIKWQLRHHNPKRKN